MQKQSNNDAESRNKNIFLDAMIVSRTFNPDWSLSERNVIEEDAILVLDSNTGDVISGFGSNMFYLPHGLTIDGDGNTYVTDTGLHQVMRVS